MTVFVYFKAPAAQAGEIERRLQGLVTRTGGDQPVVDARFGRRMDPTHGGVQTWLEQYTLEDHTDPDAWLVRQNEAAHQAGLCPPLLLGERHVEVFRWLDPDSNSAIWPDTNESRCA